MNLRLVRRAAVAFATLLLCASAQAQLFRAYLASDGGDANPCTLPQPCRLLPAALAAVADGGEIWMLDSANFNSTTVNIAKSVTIVAIPGAVGSIVAVGSYAIFIDTPGVKVTLRNLRVVPFTSPVYGIFFAQGAELRILDCEVSNLPNTAILATASGGQVYVRNTVVRGSQVGFASTTGVVASIDGSHFTGNGYGVIAGTGSRVTVGSSVIAGNISAGLSVGALNGNTGRLVVEGSRISGNGYGIQAYAGAAPGTGEVLEVAATRNVISDNEVGIFAAQPASTTVTVVLDGNVLSGNASGVIFGGATVYSRANNTLRFNGSDFVGGSLTVLAAQ